MAVYKRGYQRYQGPVTGHWTRLLAVPRFAWDRLFQQRLVVSFMVAAMIWPLSCAVYIYLVNHADAFTGLGFDVKSLVEVNAKFFYVFMRVQSMFVVVLAALAGPGLIAPDLANNALPLYFSRPLTRPDYVAGKLSVLVVMLSMITWVPGMALFGMQIGMAGWGWFTSNWRIGAGLLATLVIWVLLVSLVALASSAYVRWAKVAGAAVLGFFFVLAGVGEMVNQVLRVTWGWLLSPTWAINRISVAMLGVEPPEGPGLFASTLTLLVMTALLLAVLERKLRPVEVIS